MLRITALALALSACTTLDAPLDEAAPPDESGQPELVVSGDMPARPPVSQPEALVTDMCDEATYTDAPWTTVSSTHLSLSFPAGTAADLDRADLVMRLEAAYTDIRAQLGITTEPQVTVNLSPNRVAAEANGKGMGR